MYADFKKMALRLYQGTMCQSSGTVILFSVNVDFTLNEGEI